MLLFLGATVLSPLRAQMTDDEKKTLFLKSQQSSSNSVTSGSGATQKKKEEGSTPKSSKKSSSTHSKNSKSKSKSSKKKKQHHADSSEPVHHQTQGGERQSGGATTHHSTHLAAPPVPHGVSGQGHGSSPMTGGSSASLPLPHGATPSAPIIIEKSGVETAEGFEPAPTPPPSTGHGWDWLFGSHRTYNYLSASTRAAIDHAPVRRGRWKYIVVHNSGTREGNARVFDIYHRRVRHMVNGLAYHFVIGDGHGSGDGEIEVGHRWTAQLNGGHVASDYLNDIALGICLVGDFNRDRPTKAQIGALEELVTYLRSRVGRVHGRQSIVYAHKEINPRPTDCPGSRFPYGWLHAQFGKPN